VQPVETRAMLAAEVDQKRVLSDPRDNSQKLSCSCTRSLGPKLTQSLAAGGVHENQMLGVVVEAVFLENVEVVSLESVEFVPLENLV
jgi:hypothetical protein